jgi:hypothetical protein
MLCLRIGYHTAVYYYTDHAGNANVSAKNLQVNIRSNVHTKDTNIFKIQQSKVSHLQEMRANFFNIPKVNKTFCFEECIRL